MIRLAIAGATGRAGRCVVEQAGGDDRFEIAAALTGPGCSMSGRSMRFGDCDVVITETLDVPCDVLIDFTVADGTMAWLEVCKKNGVPMLIGNSRRSRRRLASSPYSRQQTSASAFR